MCELCANACRGATTRRGALGLSFSALTAAFAISSGNQHQKTPPETQNVIAPDAALDRLMKGNDRYVQGVSCRHDFAHEREALAGGQNPFAAVLSCVDSRIAPECFDTARGDLFVCRIAGNCERRNDRQLEYAVQVLNPPLMRFRGKVGMYLGMRSGAMSHLNVDRLKVAPPILSAFA